MLQLLVLALALFTTDSVVPQVLGVYPSGPVISAHTLRLFIQFASPQHSEILPRLTLESQDDTPITEAFLKQELWSPDRRVLTILFDPARLKTDLGRQRRLGAPLEGQSEVKLLLNGLVIKSWRVKPERCRVPVLSEWQINPPGGGGLSPLTINFPEPIDYQALHLIAVLDSDGLRLSGDESFTHSERQWIFMPSTRWTPGIYRILVHPDLENPCGDQIGDAFEHTRKPVHKPRRSRSFRVSASPSVDLSP